MDVGADNFRFTLEDKNGLKENTQTIRQPKTTELHIDSLDRYTPSMLTTTTWFTNYPNSQVIAKLAGPILLNSSLNATGYPGTGLSGFASNPMVIQTSRPLSYGYYSRVALTQFFLKMQQPTILSGYNGTFTIYIGTAPGTITGQTFVNIPQGFYTYASMATAIQAALRGLTGNPLPLATVTAPALPGDGYVFSTGDAAVYMAMSLTFPGGVNEDVAQQNLRCGRNLGFNRALYGYSPEANTGGQPGAPALWRAAAGGPPNFLCTDYVDIVSQSLTNYKDAKDTNSSIAAPNAVLGRIWLTENAVDVGGTTGYDVTEIGSAPISLVKTWTNPNWCQWSPNQSIDKIDIKLLDMFGQPLYWSTTFQTEWSATLTLTE